MSGADAVNDRDRLKQAVLTIRRLQQRVASLERAAREPIAIIGLGCRYPGGVTSPAEFWQLLAGGVDAITEVPASRWDPEAYFDADPTAPGKMYTLAGGFIDDMESFDAEFFGVSPREAEKIDPQHRIFLEVAWEALEHAGIPPAALQETRTGVFVGITGFEYGFEQSTCGLSSIDAYTMTGTKLNFAAGRLSFLLGLQGPSLAIDTACSSSLVALHVATRSLRAGDCDMALVGGVNAILAPEQTIAECKAGMLSPDGRCKTFDAGADGFVRGEGCGAVVIKRLRDAVADGDPIVAIIPGSAVNQDGPSSGLTVPNRLAQEALVRSALDDAGLEPDDIDFVEAHGTGTPLGDPIEVRALANVFGAGNNRRAPLRIGAVKTNIGHLESAAGIAGLIKTVLSLAHAAIPPHLHLQKLNPAVAWSDIPIEVPTELTPWPAGQRPRRAGVSSFGASGTNAHVIVEEWRGQEDERAGSDRPVHVLAMSAKSEEVLAGLASRYAKALKTLPSDRFADACYTSTAGRSHFAHRLAIRADSVATAQAALSAFVNGDDHGSATVGYAGTTAPRVALLFSGQGAQYAGMGKVLYASQPTFRRLIDKCNELLLPHMDRPLIDVLFAEDDDGALIHQTTYTQPALFALEYAMAQLWMSWGIKPAVLLGHSIGEYAAACIAGLLELPDALRLVAARGRLMGQLPAGGAMAAVFSPHATVRENLRNRTGLSIAAVNGPENVVISGDTEALEIAIAEFAEQGIESRRLEVSHAFHSAHMEPILDEFAAAAGTLTSSTGKVPVVSNVTAEFLDPGDAADPQYWRRQTRGAVQFEKGMRKLATLDIDVFLEVGPSSTLLGMGSLCLQDHRGAWLPSLRPDRDDWQQISETLAQLYVIGTPIDWRAFDRDFTRRKVHLPVYPFDKKRHWIVESTAAAVDQRKRRSQLDLPHPLLGARLLSPLTAIQFETNLDLNALTWLEDHRVFGTPVVSATAFVEMVLAAASEAVDNTVAIEDLFVHAPLVLEPGEVPTVQIVLEPAGDTIRFSVATLKSLDIGTDAWTLHVSGRIERLAESPQDQTHRPTDMAVVESRCPEALSTGELYRGLTGLGVELGPSYQTVERVCRGDGESFGSVCIDRAGDDTGFVLHPGLLDGCFQVAREALPETARAADSAPLVPMRIARLRVHRPHASRATVHARLRAASNAIQGGSYDVDLLLVGEDNHLIAEVDGLRVVHAERSAFSSARPSASDDVLYELKWRDKPLSPDTDAASSAQWLVFGQGDPLTETLTQQLRDEGVRVWYVRPADQFNISGTGDCGIRPDRPEDFDHLIEETLGRHPEPGVVLYGWGAGLHGISPELSDIEQAVATLCQGLLHLAQAAERQSTAKSVSLVIATCDSQQSRPSLAGVVQAPLWGLGRVIMTEQSRLNCRLLDVDQGDDKAASRCIAEVVNPDGEKQIRYRNGRRAVARLAKYRGQKSMPAGGLPVRDAIDTAQPYRLTLETPGLPDSLYLRRAGRREPGPGEVEIAVYATGLNFRDVLVALDVYQGEAGPLGGECAGRVVAVGPGVERVSIGDDVVAFAVGSAASHVVTDAELTWPIPKGLSFEQAAANPIAYLTAAYCLDHLAGMSADDRVLVHCAAGGVGMAAVQLAQRAGAEIFATAGSPEKRALVSAQGVQHVMDSRSLDFAAESMSITEGKGLDIVLNSLAGEFIEKGLSVLRKGGRFVEIGRTDTWTPEEVAKRFPEVDYWSVLLGDVCEADPALIQEMGTRIMAAIESGELASLPITSYPIEQAADAFRFMAQGKHTGKLVLTATPGKAEHQERLTISPDHAYLVTGGFGGLGLEVARWLADNGAGHIALIGRSGGSDEANAAIDALRESGAKVSAIKGDVTRRTDVLKALSHVDDLGCPLGGVIHAAGILDDGILTEQNWARAEAVLAAKVTGSWLLHEHTKDRDLHLFVLFSSASSLFGSAGQSSYAAANAFLDNLAKWRRANGLAGLSLNWGPWSDAGMFVDSGHAGARSAAAHGFRPLPSEASLAGLTQALKSDVAQLGVFLADWTAHSDNGDSEHTPLLVSDLVTQQSRPAITVRKERFKEELAAAPMKRRAAILQRRLQVEVAAVLGNDPSSIKTSVGFRELGMDSLMAVELRNRLEKLLDRSLVSTLAFDHPNVISLTEFLLREGPADAAATDGSSASDVVPETMHADVAIDDLLDISSEDAEQLLLAELSKVREADGNG